MQYDAFVNDLRSLTAITIKTPADSPMADWISFAELMQRLMHDTPSDFEHAAELPSVLEALQHADKLEAIDGPRKATS